MAFHPVENRAEWVLQLLAHSVEVFRQLVVQSADQHPLHRLQLLFRPLIELMIAALLILGHAHEDQPLVVQCICLVLHQLHNALLYVFVAQEDLFEELVELGKLLVNVAARDSIAIGLDLLVCQFECHLVLGENLAGWLLLDLFEQLFYVRDLAVLNMLGWPDEILELLGLYQVRNLTQLQYKSLQVEPALNDEPHVFVAHQLLRRRAGNVDSRPVGSDYLSEQKELIVAPIAFKVALRIQT